MKATLVELDGFYVIDLEAETLEDAARCVRFALNRTMKIDDAFTYAYSKGFSTTITIKRRKLGNLFIEPS